MSYVAEYGSKRGALAFYKARLAMLTGHYRRYQQINFARVERLVFVCKGNICRSAFADVYGRQLGLNCASGGIDTRGGDPANERVMALALQRGIDMGEHRTQRLGQLVLGSNDLLIGMEPWHLAPMQAAANGAQITLLGLWRPPYRPYLHDPFGADDSYMENCVTYIAQCVTALRHQLSDPG